VKARGSGVAKVETGCGQLDILCHTGFGLH